MALSRQFVGLFLLFPTTLKTAVISTTPITLDVRWAAVIVPLCRTTFHLDSSLRLPMRFLDPIFPLFLGHVLDLHCLRSHPLHYFVTIFV